MLPDDVKQLIDTLEANGFSAYLVGGAVRDTLLRREPADYDLATDAPPEKTAALFGASVDGRAVIHGTVGVHTGVRTVEITTFRVDGTYSDARHPDCVSFIGSLREDCMRRDFTVNALAYRPQDGVLDFVGGQRDLSLRVIRCVGDPQKRFSEDALRILRAIRFSARLGFAIEPQTARACITEAARLREIARPRVADELLQTLSFSGGLAQIARFLPVLRVLFPACAPPADLPPGPFSLPVSLALLFPCGLPPYAELPLKTALCEKTRAVLACAAHLPQTKTELCHVLYDAGEETVRDALLCASLRCPENRDVMRCHAWLDALPPLPRRPCDLAVCGHDLVNAGLEGEAVGRALRALFCAVLCGDCENTKAALIKHISYLNQPDK